MLRFKNKKEEHKICMYVEKDALKMSDEVQKDIDLEDILLNHTKFYDDIKVADKDGYIPLSFATTVRTVYSNRVVGTKLMNKKKVSEYPVFYKELSEIEMLPHKGLDLVMYLTSVSLFSIVDYKKGFDDLMLHSEFQSIGLYYNDLISPIIYSHIYIDDSLEKDFEKYMNDRSAWYDIEDIKKHYPFNLKAFIDTLIITEPRKEEEDE